MMRRIIMAIAVLLVCVGAGAQTAEEQQISPTRYDYSKVSQQITAGCSSKYDQARAIYRWLCDNISYDTSYSIYTADECWEQRRGVCQAYSELFFRLAEPIGLKTLVVRGLSKAADGAGTERHAWVFAIVEEPGTGIMIDPTWGAGSVSGSTFTRSENDNSWFDVDPYWMIFTHLPDNEQFQLIDQHIAQSQFEALPDIKPMWGEYGFSAREIYDRCRAGNADLPEVFIAGMGKMRIAQMPMVKELRVGERYIFAVQKLEQCDIAIMDGKSHSDWQLQGDTYVMEYMPTAAGEAHLAFSQGGSPRYSTVVRYDIAQPTAADLARLEAENPLLMPEVTGLKNFNARWIEKYGIDGSKLLAAVRRGEVKSLPIFYDTQGSFTAHDIPLNGTLRIGQSYTFTITPRNGLQWAVVCGNKWLREWTTDPHTGQMSITITPAEAGQLGLVVKLAEGGKFEYCLGYEVK